MSSDNPSSRVRSARRAPTPSTRTSTVYEDIADLLGRAGWAQGVGVDGRGRYSLRGAVDAVVSSTASRADERVGRSARCCNHLRELAGTTNIDAWNDAPQRHQDDVFELLLAASRLHADD
jgi:hypothetical protein